MPTRIATSCTRETKIVKSIRASRTSALACVRLSPALSEPRIVHLNLPLDGVADSVATQLNDRIRRVPLVDLYPSLPVRMRI